MRQDWQDKIAASSAELEKGLGSQSPALRCASRFGLAVTGPLNAWYADELARGTEPGVLLQVLPRCLGQMLGIVVHNNGGRAELAEATSQLLILEMVNTLRLAAAGHFEDMKVRNPGVSP